MLALPCLAIYSGNSARKHPPKTMSSSSSYATALSMQSREAWNFAHKYIGNLWFKGGVVLSVVAFLLAYFLLPSLDKNKSVTVVMVFVLVQLFFLAGCVYPTEKTLAKKFPMDRSLLDEGKSKPVRMILDVDTGVDDALALLFALKQTRRIYLEAVVCSYGNVSAELSAENTLKIMELVGAEREIPVIVGAKCALDGTVRECPVHIHGENGLGNAVLPEPIRKPIDADYADFIYELVAKNPKDIVYVTTGPMTSLAKTIEKHPDMPALLKRFVAMGGAIDHEGNVLPCSEANIYADPKATNICFGMDCKKILVPLDATYQAMLKKEDLLRLKNSAKSESSRKIAGFLYDAFEPYIDFYNETEELHNSCPVHDPLAVLIGASPFSATRSDVWCRAEENGELTRGMLVCDKRHKKSEEFFNIEYAYSVDGKSAVAIILDSLK